jgi:hypothetical protein
MSDSPSPPAIRASDAERRRALQVLRDAVVEGRLTLEEYSDRVGGAIAAKTDQDLAALTRDLPAPPASAPRSGPPAENRAVFSHLVRRGPIELDGKSSYVSLFSTIDLDLREATLLSAEVELSIRNIFGTVTVLVPEGVDVRVDGGGIFASQHVDTSPRPVPGAPVIRIHASGPGGSLYVRTHQPRGWRDLLTSGGDPESSRRLEAGGPPPETR